VVSIVNLIILGPPGSGKGTYSKELEKILGITRISTGDIFRREIEKKTRIGRMVEKLISEGKLAPDDLTIKIVFNELKKIGKKDFILDGFPRTVKQAEALEKFVKIDALILLKVAESILIKKLAGRRVCIECGKPYNVANIDEVVGGVHYVLPPIKPKVDGVCDVCGGRLIRRDDDAPSAIKERLKYYRKITRPVIRYYTGRVPIIRVTANKDINTVTRRILSLLKRRGLT